MREDEWLRDFHGGKPSVLEALYRQYFADVLQTVRRRLTGADAETVTQEVFFRLLTQPALRENFRGGNLRAWLLQVTSNATIDHLRRRRRFEGDVGPANEDGEDRSSEAAEASSPTSGAVDDELDAKLLIARFRAERLPPAWAPVFDARFLRELPQRDAALELGIPRSTLAYQETQIRNLLRDFLLKE